MPKFAFSKKLRLATPVHYASVFKKSKQTSTPQFIILGRKNSLGYPRIGLTVAKKNVKKAHERNRIKRLTRESFRLYQHELPAMDFIVLARKGVAELNNHTLFTALEKLWSSYYPFGHGTQ